MDYLGNVFIFLGALAFIVSAIGLIRMPDVYTRLHVGTKATTIATLMLFVGVSIIEPSWSLKLFLLGVFIFLTNPLSSSVLARATHKDGLHIEKDDLKEIE